MPPRRLRKTAFGVFFLVAVVGAMLLVISQIPQSKEYYDVVDTRSFSVGQPLTFDYTFEPNVRYRFEVKGVNWTSPPFYNVHYLSVEKSGPYLYNAGEGPAESPWVWYYQSYVRLSEGTVMNVTFWHPIYSEQVIDWSTTPTLVEISELKQGTYRLTYLIYVGLPLLIIGAILTTISGKNVDSRMRTQ